MPNSSSESPLANLGAAAPSYGLPPMRALGLGAYGSPGRFSSSGSGSSNSGEELASLAAQVLADPLAVRQLSQRVMQLLEQDLTQQRERGRGYGRRW